MCLPYYNIINVFSLEKKLADTSTFKYNGTEYTCGYYVNEFVCLIILKGADKIFKLACYTLRI